MALIATLALACVSAQLASGAVGRRRPVHVGCGNVIDYMSPHQVRMLRRWRLALGTASLPTSIERARPVPGLHRWRYWSKQGVAVLAGTGPPVEISLAPSWARKARLTWGNGLPRGSTIVFSRCDFSQAPGQTWLAYAGGFYIRGPRACVPLRVRVGNTTASVTVGVGRRCH